MDDAGIVSEAEHAIRALMVDDAAIVERFGVAEIMAIHRRLTASADKRDNKHLAGRIRTQQNWIGGNDHNPCGADFVPPPPEDVARLLDDLCGAMTSRCPPI